MLNKKNQTENIEEEKKKGKWRWLYSQMPKGYIVLLLVSIPSLTECPFFPSPFNNRSLH